MRNPLQELVFPHLDSIARQIERRSDCRLSGESEVIFSDADYASIFGAEYKKWLKMIDSEVNKWKGSDQHQGSEGWNDRAEYWGCFFSPSTEGSLDQYIETLESACCCCICLCRPGLFSGKSRNPAIPLPREDAPLISSSQEEKLVGGTKTIMFTVFDDVKKQLLWNKGKVVDKLDSSLKGRLRSLANWITRYIVLEIVAYMSQQFMENTDLQPEYLISL